MDMSLQDFYHEFRQEILAGGVANNNFLLQEFVDFFVKDLAETGFVEDVEFCHYRAPRGMRVDGYWFDEEGILSLFIADFESRVELLSLTQTDIKTIFRRLVNFFEASGKKRLWQELEVTSPEYSLARQIEDRLISLRKINLFLLSERALSDRVKELESEVVCDKPIYYHVWDIARLYRQYTARGCKEPLDIDFLQMFGYGLPCLRVDLQADNYRSYLAAVPGNILAKLYGEYDSRLLEQNVRTFLQAKASVNKGIRETILNSPTMFFAYNNGITATAQEVDVDQGRESLAITRIRDLQIVNGGQTTASLFHTQRKDKASLDQVFVQMKLSVIDSEKSEEIVPKISEYANTQNPVKAADFFSNSPFHLRMEEFSRRVLAPAHSGAQRETKWFYERVRGQYAEAQSKLTSAETKRFLAISPKNQVFSKEDLAMYENVWDDHPKYVSKGRQKNFAQYATKIGKAWDVSAENFNEQYFKRIVARAIIFRETRNIISAQPWYRAGGNLRSYIVYYSLACLGELAHRRKKAIPFALVWIQQDIPDALREAIATCASFINDHITQPSDNLPRDSEWFKKDICWSTLKDDISTLEARQSENFWSLLASREEEKELNRNAVKVQLVDDGIAAQKLVVSIPAPHWQRIMNELSAKKLLSEKEHGILAAATQIPSKIPSEKQCRVLIEILEKAKGEGIVWK